MKSKYFICLAILAFSSIVSAQKYKSVATQEITKDWQGVQFSSTQTLEQNISKSASFTVMAEVLKSESLQATLNKEEMITVFVSNDASFNALDDTTREALLKDTERLSKMVSFHTVPGRLDKMAIEKAISFNDGTAYFLTLEGAKLKATKEGDLIYLSDNNGNRAVVKETNFYHKNGFFHIVEGIAYATKKEKEE
jgi:uncharacterized surface protein with fasciclin (FAS1) repeats